jgi:hypothetical protein
MAKQPLVYLAMDSQDKAVADILRVHLEHAGFKCLDRRHVKELMNEESDIQGTMEDCDTLIVIDSKAFRSHSPNYELKFAQELEKPLVVISLHQQVDESKSTRRVRLFDFTKHHHRDWERLIKTIVELTREVTTESTINFLF